MSAADRARALERIAKVQAEMVKLADWKLVAARRTREGLMTERLALASLVGGEEPLGVNLSKAAIRTGISIDRRVIETDGTIARLQTELTKLRRRDQAVTSMSRDANAMARREAEAKDLSETMEAWLARASLP